MSVPLVTGIIPCHNHEGWVPDAMRSIAQQEYPNKRLIVVNDGSTDNSEQVILGEMVAVNQLNEFQWAGRHKDFNDMTVVLATIPVEEETHGPSVARNVGFQIGWDQTDLFAMLDSDDTYAPGKIGSAVKIWKEYPNMIGGVYSDFLTVSTSTGLQLLQSKEPFDRGRLIQECIINCDSIISRKAIEAVGPFDEEMRVCEDYDLWMRVSEKFTIVHVPEPLVNVRVGDHSSTANVKNEIWQQSWQRVMNKAAIRMQNG